MKELEFQKFSLGRYKKRVLKSKIAEGIIVSALFAFMPVLGVIITKDYAALSTCVLIPFFIIFIVSVSKDEYLNMNWKREYKIWLFSRERKQIRKQDRKLRKWLM